MTNTQQRIWKWHYWSFGFEQSGIILKSELEKTAVLEKKTSNNMRILYFNKIINIRVSTTTMIIAIIYGEDDYG